MSFFDRIKQGWNAFANPDQFPTTPELKEPFYTSNYTRPDRPRFHLGNERSLLASALNRIAIDVASNTINHVRCNDEGRFQEVIHSSLDSRFNLNANVDQTGREFIQDAVMSLCDEGCIAICITAADIDPNTESGARILSLRVGQILEWYPDKVKVRVYNELTGNKEDLFFKKDKTAIVENPLYSVMNESNSTLRRLIRKLNILDAIDEQSGSGKLDLILQVPYMVTNPRKKEYVEGRRKEIETQLANSKYGIAYTDGTEHVIQLNRPVENNLMSQIEYLTKMFYNQLGMSEAVISGTAEEYEMLNYYTRTIEPFLAAIVNAMRWKFLTPTARSQGQDIKYFRDPFKLVPVEKLAEIGDKLTRNEILSSNEMRAIMGYKPSKDPRADQLINSNINQGNNDTRINPNLNQNGSQTEKTKETSKSSIVDNFLKEMGNQKI